MAVGRSSGDDLATIVNGGVAGQTFCIHAGTYDIGTRSLTPKPNCTITKPMMKAVAG